MIYILKVMYNAQGNKSLKLTTNVYNILLNNTIYIYNRNWIIIYGIVNAIAVYVQCTL